MLCVLLFLTVCKAAVALQCSAQQLVNGSGAPDLQQAITMAYCYVDDCIVTIPALESGELLDIVYTTDSILVLIPQGNQTSTIVINKMEDEFDCALLGPLIPQGALILVTSIILITYLAVKKLHNAFGTLMILFNSAVIFRCVASFVMLLAYAIFRFYSQPACYGVWFTFMQGLMIPDELAACILAHIAAIMYYSDKLQADMPIKKLFAFYATYVLGMHSLFNALIIGYDLATGEYSQVIWPNGYCSWIFEGYRTVAIAWLSTAVNKMVQIVFFTIFLMYYLLSTKWFRLFSSPSS